MSRKRSLRKLYKILNKVRSYGEQMASLSDEELSHLTVTFKERLAEGETLDDILPEAFAAICEADYRIRPLTCRFWEGLPCIRDVSPR